MFFIQFKIQQLYAISTHDSSFFWQFPVGMFKAKIKEDSLFSIARAHSERNADARNNLEPIVEVVCPANAGAKEKTAHPLCGLWPGHLLTAIEERPVH